MRKSLLLFLSLFALLIPAFGQVAPCFSDQIVAKKMAADPVYAAEVNAMLARRSTMLTPVVKSAAVVIPVKVHYVHNASMPTLASITSDINDMIDQMNEDFTATNADLSSVRGMFTSDIGDMDIEFCLDQIIEVTNTESCYDSDTETDKMKSSATGGSDPIDPSHYLNIWIVDICPVGGFSGGVAGYAYLPTFGMHGSSIDGLVIDYQLGMGPGDRTATHEIGHYFGLCHPWGCGGGGCGDDDGFTDTPNSSGPLYSCTSPNACGSTEMYENFMDYCPNPHMFTIDQVNYMNNILNTTRASLKDGFGCASTLTPPTASFTADRTSICPGETVSFTDLSSGTPTSWSWSFTGGTPSSSTLQNPTVTYSTPGTYAVSLTATNAFGSDVETITGYITVYSSTAPPLSEGFEGGTFPPSGWSISNGDGDTTWQRIGTVGGYGTSSASAWVNNYFYDAAGEYDWLLSPIMDFSSASAPQVSFDYSYTYYDATLFDSLYVVYSDDCGATWYILWAEGKDGLATVPARTSSFSPTASDWATITLPAAFLAGESSVQFAWVNANGYGNNLFLDNINILGVGAATPPDAEFVGVPNIIPVGSTVDFTDLSTNTPTSWSWTFTGGAPGSSALQNPTGITYSTVGTYQVSLTATNADGSDTETKVDYITVYDTVTGPVTCDDSTFLFDGQFFFVDDEDSAGFAMTRWDQDGEPLDPYLAGFGWTSNWMTFYTVIAPGDTNFFQRSVSWHADTLTPADNWLTWGPITIPSDGAEFSWYHRFGNNFFRDGYELKINTVGDDPTDFSGAPVLYSVTDNDVTTDGDTTWVQQMVTIDGGVYGGSDIYLGIHHDALNMLWLDMDAFVLTKCGTNAPVADFSASPTTACVGETVSFTDLSSGSPAPTGWTWTFAGGTPASSTLQNPSITYDTPGSYDVTLVVSSATGSDTLTIPNYITVSSSPSVSSSSVDPVTCFGGSDGSATVAGSGGLPGYTYAWSTGASGSTASGLSGGTYDVTVTDANGCEGTTSVSVPSPVVALGASTSSVSSTCSLANGSATAIGTGGWGSYTYAWSTGGSTATISGVSAGTYFVTITDGEGCATVQAVIVSDAGTTLGTTSIVQDILCTSTGGANVVVTGGSSPYGYSWSTGATTSNISGVTVPGTYSVTITDAIGCTTTETVSITDGTYTVTMNFSTVDASCGLSDGSAQVTPVVGSGPYTYAWSTGSTTDSIDAVSSGIYTVTVNDVNGCTGVDSVGINDAGAPTISVTSSNVSCGGASDGTITISATGGATPYSYSLDGISFGPTSSFTGLGPGSYIPTVEGNDGCTSFQSVTITEPTPLTIAMDSVNETCGSGNGQAIAFVGGGSPSYTYIWSNGATTATASSVSAGMYSVTATDANLCTITGSVTVNNSAAPLTTVIATDETCDGDDNGTATVATSGGTSPFTYFWSNGSTADSISGLAPGSYTVTVTDAIGCTSVSSATVNGGTSISATVTSTDATDTTAADGSATATGSGGSTPYTYSWSNGATGSTATGLTPGTYTVTVTDADGCETVESVTVGFSVGIEDEAGFVNINLYPNPTFNQITLDMQLAKPGDVQVTLFNSLGQKMMIQDLVSFTEGKHTVDLTGFAQGLYYIELSSETGSKVFKVTKLNE